MIMNAPTMLAPIMVRPASVLNHFVVTISGLWSVIVWIQLSSADWFACAPLRASSTAMRGSYGPLRLPASRETGP
jgi:hypothetical protein